MTEAADIGNAVTGPCSAASSTSFSSARPGSGLVDAMGADDLPPLGRPVATSAYGIDGR